MSRNGTNNILSEYNKGYLESAIDFEGMLTIRLSKNKSFSHGYEVSPIGAIFNTNIDLLRKIQLILGGGSIVIHQKYRNDKNWKTAYRYQFTRRIMREVLPQLTLIEKEKQRLLVIKALEIVKQGERYWTGHKMPDKVYHELCGMSVLIRTYNARGLNANWNKKRGMIKRKHCGREIVRATNNHWYHVIFTGRYKTCHYGCENPEPEECN